MTEHLTECPKFALRYTISRCICDALRRCERRVRFSVAQEGAMESGWKAGVQAAREAIKAEFMQEGKLFNCYYECTNEALAAIDTLKGDR